MTQQHVEKDYISWVLLDEVNATVLSRSNSFDVVDRVANHESMPIRRTPDVLTNDTRIDDSLIQAEKSLLTKLGTTGDISLRVINDPGEREISDIDLPEFVSPRDGNRFGQQKQTPRFNSVPCDFFSEQLPKITIVRNHRPTERSERRSQRRERKAMRQALANEHPFYRVLKLYTQSGIVTLMCSHILAFLGGLLIGHRSNLNCFSDTMETVMNKTEIEN